jgi:hypothetical protein
MTTLNTIILIILIVLAVLIFTKSEHLDNTKQDDLYKEENYDYLDEVFDNIIVPPKSKNIIESKKIQKLKSTKQIKIKPYFVDMRVHNDYRDTLTAFNDVAPDQRPMFNRSMLPVKQVEVNPKQVKPLVRAFLKRVNDDVKYNVSDSLNEQSGFDEFVQEKRMETDGWGEEMKQLGLPESLYLKPAKRAKIVLVKIDAVEKYATEDQLNFIVHMIVQKKNSSDQMIVKVSFILDNYDVNADRNLNKKDAEIDYNAKIEEIYVIGFLTSHQYGDPVERKDFYQFENIEKDEVLDQELILKALQEKYKQRQIESDGFNISISPNQNNDAAIFRLASNTPYKPIGGNGEYVL